MQFCPFGRHTLNSDRRKRGKCMAPLLGCQLQCMHELRVPSSFTRIVELLQHLHTQSTPTSIPSLTQVRLSYKQEWCYRCTSLVPLSVGKSDILPVFSPDSTWILLDTLRRVAGFSAIVLVTYIQRVFCAFWGCSSRRNSAHADKAEPAIPSDVVKHLLPGLLYPYNPERQA